MQATTGERINLNQSTHEREHASNNNARSPSRLEMAASPRRTTTRDAYRDTSGGAFMRDSHHDGLGQGRSIAEVVSSVQPLEMLDGDRDEGADAIARAPEVSALHLAPGATLDYSVVFQGLQAYGETGMTRWAGGRAGRWVGGLLGGWEGALVRATWSGSNTSEKRPPSHRSTFPPPLKARWPPADTLHTMPPSTHPPTYLPTRPYDRDPNRLRLEEMVDAAFHASDQANAAGARVPTGAALFTSGDPHTSDGKVMLYAGCTVESSSDPALSVCAERTTLLKAVSEGRVDVMAMAIADATSDDFPVPDGNSRQFLSEVGGTERAIRSATPRYALLRAAHSKHAN